MRDRRGGAPDGDAGFSLVELLVVVGIIMILAAMATPAIGRYFRLFRIRGAQQQVTGAIQTARGRAIAKNVNLGVSFVIESPTRYWIHIEDDQSTAHSRVQQTLTFATPNTVQSTVATLPEGVRFAAGAAECPNGIVTGVGGPSTGFSPNSGWFHFNRLGAWSWCGVNPCVNPPTSGTGPANDMMSDTSGSLVCLYQPVTGLSRALLVSPGGRVRVQR